MYSTEHTIYSSKSESVTCFARNATTITSTQQPQKKKQTFILGVRAKYVCKHYGTEALCLNPRNGHRKHRTIQEHKSKGSNVTLCAFTDSGDVAGANCWFWSAAATSAGGIRNKKSYATTEQTPIVHRHSKLLDKGKYLLRDSNRVGRKRKTHETHSLRTGQVKQPRAMFPKGLSSVKVRVCAPMLHGHIGNDSYCHDNLW